VSDKFLLTDGNAQTALAASDVVLLASGTASLQAALLGKPVVAAYRLAPLTYWIANVFGLVKVPYFSLPNLLTKEALVPEFIQSKANSSSLAAAVGDLLDDPGRREVIAAEFAMLRTALAMGADQRAAAAVLELVAQR
jgi:lipid-A-disaccharide synthase